MRVFPVCPNFHSNIRKYLMRLHFCIESHMERPLRKHSRRTDNVCRVHNSPTVESDRSIVIEQTHAVPCLQPILKQTAHLFGCGWYMLATLSHTECEEVFNAAEDEVSYARHFFDWILVLCLVCCRPLTINRGSCVCFIALSYAVRGHGNDTLLRFSEILKW